MVPKVLNLVVVICLWVSFPASAAVYQCKLPGGKISFSDKPCDDSASGQKLDKFDRIIEREVSATVSLRNLTRQYLDGYAYWAKPNRELTAVLYMRALTEDEMARVANGDRLNTYAEESTGRVTLFFEGTRPSRTNFRHLRSVFTGFSPDNPKSPWTTNHRRTDLVDVVEKFSLVRDEEGETWLLFRSRESTENIRWLIEFALPVVP